MPTHAQRVEATRAHAGALRPVVAEIIASDITTLTRINNELNARDIRAADGGQWVPAQVNRLLQRRKPMTAVSDIPAVSLPVAAA